MKIILILTTLYFICANFAFAQRERELRDWSNGYRSAYNTYILKKSKDPTALISIPDSIPRDLPSTQEYVKNLMSAEKTRILIYSINKNIIFENYLKDNHISDFKIYLSQPDKEYKGIEKGYVTEYFENFTAHDLNDSQFFICGGMNMIKSTEQLLLARGVQQEKILYEKFY